MWLTFKSKVVWNKNLFYFVHILLKKMIHESSNPWLLLCQNIVLSQKNFYLKLVYFMPHRDSAFNIISSRLQFSNINCSLSTRRCGSGNTITTYLIGCHKYSIFFGQIYLFVAHDTYLKPTSVSSTSAISAMKIFAVFFCFSLSIWTAMNSSIVKLD